MRSIDTLPASPVQNFWIRQLRL